MAQNPLWPADMARPPPPSPLNPETGESIAEAGGKEEQGKQEREKKMSENGDAAIKLFGKTIPLRPSSSGGHDEKVLLLARSEA